MIIRITNELLYFFPITLRIKMLMPITPISGTRNGLKQFPDTNYPMISVIILIEVINKRQFSINQKVMTAKLI